MAQWGVRRRVVFLGQHQENKPQLSSSTSEEEDSKDEVKGTVKTEPLEIPEFKKRKRLSRGQLKEVKTVLRAKKRQSNCKGRSKKHDKLIERWTVERYKLAEQNIVEILKAEDATFGNAISRSALRLEARKRIGDTGLLDHLLKHIDGKAAPGGNERFRRWFNPNGIMEYWLESADLVNIRREAGVHDPYWIPPSRLMPSGGPSEDSVSAGELRLLREEVDKMKSDMQELLVSKKQVKDQAHQDKFEELMIWKAKVDQQLVEITNVLSNMQVPKQYTATNPVASERWEDWLESTNLDNFQGNELVPWFESSNLVNTGEEVIIQDPYPALPPRLKHGNGSSEDPLCTVKEEMAELERDVHEVAPKKEKGYQANVTPDFSATANSKSDLDNLILFQEMFQELFNWKSITEQKLGEITNSVSVIKQASKLSTPPALELPEDGNHSMEYHP